MIHGILKHTFTEFSHDLQQSFIILCKVSIIFIYTL